MIIGENIVLRQTRIVDVPYIKAWENNTENWEVSETTSAYTFEEILLLIDSSEDIFDDGQLRFIIVLKNTGQPIGTLDLFQCNFGEKSAHLGILIANKTFRNKGLASEAIELLAQFCKENLQFSTLYCTIQSNNVASLNLFKKTSFQMCLEENQNAIFGKSLTLKMKRCLKN